MSYKKMMTRFGKAVDATHSRAAKERNELLAGAEYFCRDGGGRVTRSGKIKARSPAPPRKAPKPAAAAAAAAAAATVGKELAGSKRHRDADVAADAANGNDVDPSAKRSCQRQNLPVAAAAAAAAQEALDVKHSAAPAPAVAAPAPAAAAAAEPTSAVVCLRPYTSDQHKELEDLMKAGKHTECERRVNEIEAAIEAEASEVLRAMEKTDEKDLPPTGLDDPTDEEYEAQLEYKQRYAFVVTRRDGKDALKVHMDDSTTLIIRYSEKCKQEGMAYKLIEEIHFVPASEAIDTFFAVVNRLELEREDVTATVRVMIDDDHRYDFELTSETSLETRYVLNPVHATEREYKLVGDRWIDPLGALHAKWPEGWTREQAIEWFLSLKAYPIFTNPASCEFSKLLGTHVRNGVLCVKLGVLANVRLSSYTLARRIVAAIDRPVLSESALCLFVEKALKIAMREIGYEEIAENLPLFWSEFGKLYRIKQARVNRKIAESVAALRGAVASAASASVAIAAVCGAAAR